MASANTQDQINAPRLRIIGLDGVRAIAAVTVLIGHVAIHIGDNEAQPTIVRVMLGYMSHGLTLFFVLSGFLLFMPFARGFRPGQTFPPVRVYAINRVLRIFPAYWAIFLVCAFALGIVYIAPVGPNMDAGDVSGLVGRMSDPRMTLANLTLLQNVFPPYVKTGLSVAWTLSLEASFYVALPIASWVVWRYCRGRMRSSVTVATVFIMVGILGKFALFAVAPFAPVGTEFYSSWGGNWYAILRMSLIGNADLFGWGMMMVPVYHWVAKQRSSNVYWLTRVAPLALGLLAIMLLRGGELSDSAYALLCAGAVLFIAAPAGPDHRAGISARLLNVWPVRSFGEISFSVYLWHVPIIWWLSDHGWTFSSSTLGGFALNLLIVFLITAVLSAITYLAIEKPAMRLRKIWGGSSLPAHQTGGGAGPSGTARKEGGD